MRILFAIQGTGNGHLTRARDVYPELCRHAGVDVLISGIQADVEPPFPVKYRLHGASFIFGKKGGISYSATLRMSRPARLLKDVFSLPVRDYDLVVNDFEPVSAWAAKLRRVPCVSLSHQWAVLHPKAPLPDHTDRLGRLVLRRYAPVDGGFGFHFKAFAPGIFTPVIRREVRALRPVDGGHYTVYLPAYDDEALARELSRFRGVRWEVFSKHNKGARTEGAISFRPITNDAFLQSMASASGVLCGAGFEGPAEALYLGKKLLVVPMHGQFEQHCNAAALAGMGVPVVKHLGPKSYDAIWHWIGAGTPIPVHYPDQTGLVVDRLVREWKMSKAAVRGPVSDGAEPGRADQPVASV